MESLAYWELENSQPMWWWFPVVTIKCCFLAVIVPGLCTSCQRYNTSAVAVCAIQCLWIMSMMLLLLPYYTITLLAIGEKWGERPRSLMNITDIMCFGCVHMAEFGTYFFSVHFFVHFFNVQPMKTTTSATTLFVIYCQVDEQLWACITCNCARIVWHISSS